MGGEIDARFALDSEKVRFGKTFVGYTNGGLPSRND
jgi:hypothetical protein